jgi:microcystin-dependent protein
MAATPFPTNLFHTGTARPLTLAVPLAVLPTGDITLSVSGDASAQGWPSIPNGQKMIVTVGRGTQYETKYLLSSVSSGSTSSTLTVAAADRNYDGTPAIDCPAGTTVEHTVSATEMATVNDHMRTKLAHGSDGELLDQNSAQTLANKRLTAPVIEGGTISGASITGADIGSYRFTPVGSVLIWPSDTVPPGFLKCDGQAIAQVEYPELFAIVGANVPNLTGMFVKGGPVNRTPQGAATRTIAIENIPAHKHDVGVTASQGAHSHGGATWGAGGHNHTLSGDQQAQMGGSGRRITGGASGVFDATAGVGDHAHTINAEAPGISVSVSEQNKGSGQPLNIEPQHIVLQYIICAKPQGA